MFRDEPASAKVSREDTPIVRTVVRVHHQTPDYVRLRVCPIELRRQQQME